MCLQQLPGLIIRALITSLKPTYNQRLSVHISDDKESTSSVIIVSLHFLSILYKYTSVQVYNCTNIQVCKCTIIQVYNCTNIQVYNVSLFEYV